MPVALHVVAIVLAAEAGGCSCVTHRAGCLAWACFKQVPGAELMDCKDVSVQDLVEGCLNDLSASQLHQLLLDPASGESLLLGLIPAPPPFKSLSTSRCWLSAAVSWTAGSVNHGVWDLTSGSSEWRLRHLLLA